MRTVEVEYTEKQLEVLDNLKASVIWMRGGMRSGKTMAGAHWVWDRSRLNPASVDGIMVSPNYPMLQIGPRPALESVFRQMGVRWKYKGGSDKCYYWWEPSGLRHRIWVRSADKPATISGSTVGFAWADEPGMCGDDLFMRLTTRVSDARAVILQTLFTGTPEGKSNWFHVKTSQAETEDDPQNVLVRATTYDNVFNNPRYLEDIERTFRDDPVGRQQYILGIAADKAGSVYTNFRPWYGAQNGKTGHFKACLNPEAGQLCVGGDFNNHILPTPLATHYPDGTIHIWGEVVTKGDAQTEPHYRRVIEAIKQRVHVEMVRENGRESLRDAWLRPVLAYLDATGGIRRTTGITDVQLVQQAGFAIRSGSTNPQGRDRIAAVQYAFAHDKLFICPQGAPQHARAFQEHDRDQYGEPRKSSGPGADGEFQPDHYCDAGGYIVAGVLPIGSTAYKPKVNGNVPIRMIS